MYKVIWFLDNLNPHSFWKWCYIKEEDIEFANKVIDIRPYKNSFKETPKLYPKDYVEFYNNDFYLAKKVYEGILWAKRIKQLLELEIMNLIIKYSITQICTIVLDSVHN